MPLAELLSSYLPAILYLLQRSQVPRRAGPAAVLNRLLHLAVTKLSSLAQTLEPPFSLMRICAIESFSSLTASSSSCCQKRKRPQSSQESLQGPLFPQDQPEGSQGLSHHRGAPECQAAGETAASAACCSRCR